MKRTERELREKVEREVSRQLNAKDAVDIGTLDEDVDELADGMSKLEYEMGKLKKELFKTTMIFIASVGILCMLMIVYLFK